MKVTTNKVVIVMLCALLTTAGCATFQSNESTQTNVKITADLAAITATELWIGKGKCVPNEINEIYGTVNDFINDCESNEGNFGEAQVITFVNNLMVKYNYKDKFPTYIPILIADLGTIIKNFQLMDGYLKGDNYKLFMTNLIAFKDVLQTIIITTDNHKPSAWCIKIENNSPVIK